MQISWLNSTVNFTSRIEVINNSIDFTKRVKSCSAIVNEWSYKDIIKAPQAGTMGIRSCTAGGIITKSKTGIGDMFNVVLFHINPRNKDNSNFTEIEKFILNKIGDDEAVEGFLIGSKTPITSEEYLEMVSENSIDEDEQTTNKYLLQSTKMFENFDNLMKSLKIPYSKLQGLPIFGRAHIFYSSDSDKWVVYAKKFDNAEGNIKKSLQQYFDDVFICEKDELV